MCDNEDGAANLFQPVVMPLPAKRLCAWLGIEYGVPGIPKLDLFVGNFYLVERLFRLFWIRRWR